MDGNLIIPFVPQGFSEVEEIWSYADVGPTTIRSWGYGDNEVVELEDVKSSKRPAWGAVVGSSDGGLFIFHPELSSTTSHKASKMLDRRTISGEGTLFLSRRPAHLSNPHSRSTSPSGSRSNLGAMTVSKSRAVSGVSKELAEAPKNFVDFEEEQERMKDMLGDRVVRDKSLVDVLKPQLEKVPSTEKSSRPTSLKQSSATEMLGRRSDDARSILSIDSTSSTGPKSLLSPPLSPTLDAMGSRRFSTEMRKTLQIKCRILPRMFGLGHAVTDINVLEGGELFLALQECGCDWSTISLFKTLDGTCVASTEPGILPSSLTPSATSQETGSQMPWCWKTIFLASQLNSLIVFAVANVDTLSIALDSESDNKARITTYELVNFNQHQFGETKFLKLGDIVVNGRAEGVTVHQDPSGITKVYQIDNLLNLVIRPLRFLPSTIQNLATEQEMHSSPSSISLPQPLRNFISRSGASTPASIPNESSPRLDSILESNAGSVPLTGNVSGLKIQHLGGMISGLAWSTDEILIFSLNGGKVHLRTVLPAKLVKETSLIDITTLRVLYANKIETYSLPDEGINDSTLSVSLKPAHTTTNLVASITLPRPDAFSFLNDSTQMISLRRSDDSLWTMELQTKDAGKSQRKEAIRLWTSPSGTTPNLTSSTRLTAVLPLELSSFILGYSDGSLKMSSFADMVCKGPVGTTTQGIDGAIGVAILFLQLVTSAKNGSSYVVGGGDDGSVNFWDMKTLELQARWIIFCEPLVHIILLTGENSGRLRDCCLCISGDGTIAVITLENFEFLYVVPGSPAPLTRVCLGTDNLMLLYTDGRARLWDVKTREFWRSMSSEKAADLLSQGGWISMDIGDNGAKSPKEMLSALNRSTAAGYPPPTILLNLVEFIDSFTSTLSGKGRHVVNISQLKIFLAAILTPGLDDQIDRLASEFLGASGSGVSIGTFDPRSQQLHTIKNAHGAWQISPEVTASRLLTAVTVLRILMNVGGYEDPASLVLSFLMASLPSHVGPLYRPPSLPFLAHHWTESSVAEIRLAGRLLFENEVSRLQDDDIITIVEQWQHRLPCVLPDVEKQTPRAALALTICGSIAIEKYSLLSTTTITDISKSISLYLYDDSSPYRVLAIDLCSRGFDTWQQHFDAMAALRSLFILATSARKESIHVRNPGPQARMAVLQIASSNTPLFMTTLSLDILHPRSIEYSKTVMQIIAFLIRKKPLVLYPNLPRLMEAVVKSLDPGSTAEREAVFDSVTEIIALVVQTFPTVEFHSGSQRLAVGTSEGAVIMYDLKTATRLYVLEGHRKRLAGISFSPDGRRLVTLSIEESVLLVWKVGSSFTSFFHPGAPPRQGHSGSAPFKTFPCVLGGDARLSIEDTLEDIRFDWTSSRSVQVSIREALFTFST